jgi:pimeloyl-ACP methyl ester carboxylesterase
MSSEPLEIISAPGNPERHRDHPILFVHGICHGAWCWQPNYAPYFVDLGYDVHALSLRGHAGSSGHEALHANRLSDYVEDIVATAESLPSAPIIIGHSMGGGLAQLVATGHPAAARAAVLLAPMVPGGLKVRELLRTTRRGERVRPLLRLLRGRELSATQANRLPFFDGRLDADAAQSAAEQLGAESWRALLDILIRFRPPAGEAPIPMLLVGSRLDSIFEAPSLRRTGSHYGIEPLILDTGCHDLMLDPTWRESADVIANWMEKL